MGTFLKTLPTQAYLLFSTMPRTARILSNAHFLTTSSGYISPYDHFSGSRDTILKKQNYKCWILNVVLELYSIETI